MKYKREKHSGWCRAGVYLASPDEEYHPRHSRLTIYGGKYVHYFDFRPIMKSVQAKYQVNERQYGFQITDCCLTVFTGEQDMDDTTGNRKSWYYPWRSGCCIKTELFDAAGKPWLVVKGRVPSEVEKVQPAALYVVKDVDGTLVQGRLTSEAVTHRKFDRRGWHWLGYLWPTQRYLRVDLKWDKETGYGKGSWKGGNWGVSAPLLPFPTPHDWMRAHCIEQRLTIMEGPL